MCVSQGVCCMWGVVYGVFGVCVCVGLSSCSCSKGLKASAEEESIVGINQSLSEREW